MMQKGSGVATAHSFHHFTTHQHLHPPMNYRHSDLVYNIDSSVYYCEATKQGQASDLGATVEAAVIQRR